MSQNREPHIGLSSVEAENVVHYRAVSRIAIVALSLGILSATALVSQLMWCVPIVGVTLAIIALRTIARSQSAVLGRGAALVGLALSLVFLASATTGHLVRQQRLYREAEPYTRKWIEMVREGQLREAHQLQLPQEERQRLGANLQNYYEATREAREDKDALFAQTPLCEIVELGRQGQLRFEADEEVAVVRESGKKMGLVVQRYAIDYRVDGQPRTLSFLVSISRMYNSEAGEARWRIRGVDDPESDVR
jgi:hypothetical protein